MGIKMHLFDHYRSIFPLKNKMEFILNYGLKHFSSDIDERKKFFIKSDIQK